MTTYTQPLTTFRIPKGGEYGAPRAVGTHHGVDGIAAVGTQVFATIGGVVKSVAAVKSPTLGWWIVWLGDDGLFWSFSHLEAKPTLKVGARIERAQAVVRSGATGAVTGPHLHTACGTSVTIGIGSRDPMQYLTNALSPAGGGGVPITDKDHDMRNIRNEYGGIATIGETTYSPVTSDTWPSAQKVWGPYEQLSNAEFASEVAQVQARRVYSNAGIEGGSVDIDAIVTKIEARLQDEFKAIPDAVADELAGRLVP